MYAHTGICEVMWGDSNSTETDITRGANKITQRQVQTTTHEDTITQRHAGHTGEDAIIHRDTQHTPQQHTQVYVVRVSGAQGRHRTTTFYDYIKGGVKLYSGSADLFIKGRLFN